MQLPTVTLTADEARQALRDAEQRDKLALVEAETQRVEHERAVEALARTMTPRVAQLERKTKEVLAETQQRAATERPTLGSRGGFRALLLGQLTTGTGDLITSEVRAAYSDPIASALLGVCREAQTLVNALCDPMAPVRLGEGDALTLRADKCECALWGAFIARARVCAGEVKQ